MNVLMVLVIVFVMVKLVQRYGPSKEATFKFIGQMIKDVAEDDVKWRQASCVLGVVIGVAFAMTIIVAVFAAVPGILGGVSFFPLKMIIISSGMTGLVFGLLAGHIFWTLVKSLRDPEGLAQFNSPLNDGDEPGPS